MLYKLNVECRLETMMITSKNNKFIYILLKTDEENLSQ